MKIKNCIFIEQYTNSVSVTPLPYLWGTEEIQEWFITTVKYTLLYYKYKVCFNKYIILITS